MSDPLPVDEAPAPGDTFIELRDGVPYIGTEPDGAAKDALGAYRAERDELVGTGTKPE